MIKAIMEYFKKGGLVENRTEERGKLRALLEQKAQAAINESTSAMLSRSCPFLNNSKCTKGCIHFLQGYTYPWDGLDGVPDFFVQTSRCRLWK